jgi:hypothetical protein
VESSISYSRSDAIFLAGLFGQGLGFAAIAATVYWLFLAVALFSAEQVFTAALYLYANEGRVP